VTKQMTKQFSESPMTTMPSFVDPFISAISMVKPGDNREPPGDHCGTGFFLIVEGERLIVTCEHVANVDPENTLVMAQFGAEFAI